MKVFFCIVTDATSKYSQFPEEPSAHIRVSINFFKSTFLEPSANNFKGHEQPKDKYTEVPQCEGFPGGSDNKESACNVGEQSSIPESENSFEKGMPTHSSILAWRTPWTEESGVLQSMRSQQSRI